MRPKISRSAAIAILLFAGGCASGDPDPADGARTYNVRTGDGDRVTVRVTGSKAAGFEYRAVLRAVRRTDLDTLDRQGILTGALQTVMTERCGEGRFRREQAAQASNAYEQIGRFSCSGS